MERERYGSGPATEADEGTVASSTDRAPRISVVLPVLNGAATLAQCLAALRRSLFTDFEIVVVDDGSSDETAAILTAADVDLVLRNDSPAGCFAARNRGAEAARGEVLFFTDADVEVAPDTLAKVWQHCGRDGDDAVIGLYAAAHPNDNLVSQYKNAWIRWSYLVKGEHVDWFFTAVGAVRREAWQRIGGFDAGFDRRLGGGDLDFGQRLHDSGVAVRLDKTLAVVHRRRFTLASLLSNDFHRARGWAELGLSRRGLSGSARGGLANVSAQFVAAVALAGVTAALAVMSLMWPGLWMPAALSAGAYVAVSRDFLFSMAREQSPLFAARCALVQLADHLACGAGIAAAIARRIASTGAREV